MNLEQAREFKETVKAQKELAEKQYAIGEEILDERDAQDRKWGANRHMPNGTGKWAVLLEGFRASRYFGPLADQLTENTDTKAKEGSLAWLDIFLEEVFEAAAEADPVKLRAELIQCMAVGMAWVEDLDRGVHEMNCGDCGKEWAFCKCQPTKDQTSPAQEPCPHCSGEDFPGHNCQPTKGAPSSGYVSTSTPWWAEPFPKLMAVCPECGREKGCNADCEDMNCEHWAGMAEEIDATKHEAYVRGVRTALLQLKYTLVAKARMLDQQGIDHERLIKSPSVFTSHAVGVRSAIREIDDLLELHHGKSVAVPDPVHGFATGGRETCIFCGKRYGEGNHQ